MENIKDGDIEIALKGARIEREEAENSSMHIDQRDNQHNVFEDERYIPFLVRKLQHSEDPIDQDKAQLNEGHYDHPSSKLVILDKLVKVKLFANGHAVVEKEDKEEDG